MYPDAYEVGLPNQGVQILYEVLNEQPDVLAERTYAVWPDLEALMREHGVPQFTVDAHRPVGAFDVFGVSFATELGYTNLLTALDLAGIPLRAADRDDAHPSWSPAGTPRSTPSRSPTSSTRPCSATARRRSCEITAIVAAWKAEGCPGGRDELLLRLARTESVYVPRFYDVDYLPDGRIQRVVPNRAGRAVPGAQAHDDGPRRVAVPEEAAGPAGRDGARAVRGGDLPRLHPRLPVLPGRHDHPAGAGALDHHRRPDGPARAWSSPASPRSACCRCPAPTTPRSATSAPASPTSTRAPTSRCRCRRPGSTRSTSTWPRSCPATAGGPA